MNVCRECGSLVRFSRKRWCSERCKKRNEHRRRDARLARFSGLPVCASLGVDALAVDRKYREALAEMKYQRRLGHPQFSVDPWAQGLDAVTMWPTPPDLTGLDRRHIQQRERQALQKRLKKDSAA